MANIFKVLNNSVATSVEELAKTTSGVLEVVSGSVALANAEVKMLGKEQAINHTAKVALLEKHGATIAEASLKLEFIEQFVDAGFPRAEAIQMVNETITS